MWAEKVLIFWPTFKIVQSFSITLNILLSSSKTHFTNMVERNYQTPESKSYASAVARVVQFSNALQLYGDQRTSLRIKPEMYLIYFNLFSKFNSQLQWDDTYSANSL